jgi:hypothetical protein
MATRFARPLIALCTLLISTACVSPISPTEADINASIADQEEQALRSVTGPWWGTAGAGAIQLEFSLVQAPDGTVQGSGTMRDPNSDITFPITVSGKYERPTLSLTFRGIEYEGRTVEGSFTGTNTLMVGVTATLRLSADGYAKSLTLALFKGARPPASLGGRVTDAVTGNPVSGATVSVQGRSVTTSTTGHFEFNPMLLPGRHTVSVSHPGYNTVSRDVEVAPYATADFRLQPN